jgi:GAF domain-containing protein
MMSVIPQNHRSVLDFDSEAALVEALLERVKIPSTSSNNSLQRLLAHNISETPSDLKGSDWILTNSLAEQPSAEQEARRLVILKSYLGSSLGTGNRMDQGVHVLAEMAGKHCETTWACVSLVDMGRLWFKSVWNADNDAVNPNLTLPISRQNAFCAHTILQDGIFEVRDTLKDARFCNNPLVLQQPVVRYYAGVPLVSLEGVKIGAFCIMDNKPRSNGLSESERDKLTSLAAQTMQTLVQKRQEQQTARKRSACSSVEEATPIAPTTASKLLQASKESELPMAQHIPKARRVQELVYNVNSKSNSNIIIMESVKESRLPDPKTKNVDPDEYLIQLVEALYGVSPKTKPALDLKDYFHRQDTEAQIAAYSVEVCTVTRENDVNKLRAYHEAYGDQSLDCFNRFGEGLLNTACRRGFKDIVHFLLSPPVSLSLHVRDDYGRTPMHDACWNPEPQLDICTWICEQDPSLLLVSDKRGFTPFQYARKGDWHVWRQFLYDRRDLLVGLTKPEAIAQFS